MFDGKNISYLLYDDYAQSANSLFHFMTKADYLKSALSNKALIPRYCIEDIGYLEIKRDGHQFSEIAVLQKCFCDIPFHKLGENLQLKVVEEEYDKLTLDNQIKLKNHNTHFDYYGKYAIAFSKSWGEKKGLQPIHYLNIESQSVLNGRYNGYVKIDITKFYSSINHSILLKKIKRKIRKKEALEFLVRAITTQTIPRNVSAPEKTSPKKGVPEGLSISNILADIYLSDLKKLICNKFDVAFFRYVDDILILCQADQAAKIKDYVVANKFIFE